MRDTHDNSGIYSYRSAKHDRHLTQDFEPSWRRWLGLAVVGVLDARRLTPPTFPMRIVERPHAAAISPADTRSPSDGQDDCHAIKHHLQPARKLVVHLWSCCSRKSPHPAGSEVRHGRNTPQCGERSMSLPMTWRTTRPCIYDTRMRIGCQRGEVVKSASVGWAKARSAVPTSFTLRKTRVQIAIAICPPYGSPNAPGVSFVSPAQSTGRSPRATYR